MKVLIIRFSSIGDIVLTTPVIRCVKQQVKGAEVHFLTKRSFLAAVEHNPYIDKIHLIDEKVKEITAALKKEKFDFVIDLHNNLRSLQVKNALRVPSASFSKLNVKKWLFVNLRYNRMPDIHIVDRYMEAAAALGVRNDLKGLDFFIADKDSVNVNTFPAQFQHGYNALVLGGNYFTKQIPESKLREIIEVSTLPLVLLGGKAETQAGEKLSALQPEKTLNLCGKLNLGQSASVLQQSSKVITSDTGLMHIAAAFKKDIISIWGNTVPEFGMFPYLPGNGSRILQVENLSCRPCSKLGHKKCPKGHFRCMMDVKIEI